MLLEQFHTAMNLDIRRVYLLYGVGVFLGIISVFYFAFILLEDLSPTITATLLFLSFLLFGTAGLFTQVDRLDLVFYTLAAAAYLIGLWYTISRFEPGDVAVFFVLVVSSALFVGLGYLSTQGQLEIDRRSTGIVVVAVLGIGVLLVGADLAGPQPSTDLEFDDELEITGVLDRPKIGTVTITNDFTFSRLVDQPDIHACLYTPNRTEAPTSTEDRLGNQILAGGESVSSDIVLPGRAFYDRDGETLRGDLQDRETIPIEQRAECPDDGDEVKLVVIEGSPAVDRPPR